MAGFDSAFEAPQRKIVCSCYDKKRNAQRNRTFLCRWTSISTRVQLDCRTPQHWLRLLFVVDFDSAKVETAWDKTRSACDADGVHDIDLSELEELCRAEGNFFAVEGGAIAWAR